MNHRTLKWLAALLLAVLALPLLAALWVAAFGWNWARGPLQDLALQKTGRELRIAGDLDLSLAWPATRVRARAVSFANPAWATATQMVDTEAVDLTIVPRTKVGSVVALRSPFYVEGSFAKPTVGLDTGRIAARGASALVLGLLNPLLALVPLFEARPGADSECVQLVRDARAALPKAGTRSPALIAT